MSVASVSPFDRWPVSETALLTDPLCPRREVIRAPNVANSMFRAIGKRHGVPVHTSRSPPPGRGSLSERARL